MGAGNPAGVTIPMGVSGPAGVSGSWARATPRA